MQRARLACSPGLPRVARQASLASPSWLPAQPRLLPSRPPHLFAAAPRVCARNDAPRFVAPLTNPKRCISRSHHLPFSSLEIYGPGRNYREISFPYLGTENRGKLISKRQKTRWIYFISSLLGPFC